MIQLRRTGAFTEPGAGGAAIRIVFVPAILSAALLIACSSSGVPSSASSRALPDCIARFDASFRVEWDQIYPQLQSAVEAGTRNPQDPTVPANLRAVSDLLSRLDSSVQAAKCESAAQDYQFTMQGISSGLRRAAALYYDGFANQKAAEIRQATQQIAEVQGRLKHAVEITHPGALNVAPTPTAVR